jgi:hypothetical protein
MNEAQNKWTLLKQAGDALVWALFIILAPFEVLFLGAIVWIPLFVWREKLRASRHGFWPGAALRYSLIVGVVVLAVNAPLKSEDKKVGPLPRTEVTLGELVEAGVIYELFEPQHKTLGVRLSSLTPTRREVTKAIAEQTVFKTSIFHCSNGATLLFGSGVGRIRVNDRPTNEAPTTAEQSTRAEADGRSGGTTITNTR